jgi:hypothetical protein
MIQTGPAGKKALQTIAEKRLLNNLLGPGSYNPKEGNKRSYNALSEENKIE